MAKKTLALITGLVFLSVLLVGIAMQTTQPIEEPTPTPVNTPTPTPQSKTTLYLFPNPLLLKKNTAEVSVMMDAKDNEITAVQIELAYDPRSLSFQSITPSALFINSKPLLNTIDKKNGRISYIIALSTEQENLAITGQQEVAKIIFTKIGTASQSATQIEFLPKSLVTARGANHSVLTETSGTSILFSSPSPTIPLTSPTR